MVTKIRARSGRRRYLYLAEWMAERGFSDEKLANRVGVERATVTRWRNEQHRLNPEKIAVLADALNVPPSQLWHPPDPARPSIDAMLKDAPDDAVKKVAEVAAILLKTDT
jgi:transcriptional regulator with XRE-family HTH domain